MKKDREYRSFEYTLSEEEEYKVEGYASTFKPYVMGHVGDVPIYERISEHAFDNADFSDCVFRVDHEGPVYARTSAGTVTYKIDEKGLSTITDLGKTSRGRELYEEIKAGNYPQMSFAFTIEEDEYDKKTHTNLITKIRKVFDISAVTWPANPDTCLSARSKDFLDGVKQEIEAERLQKEQALELVTKIKNNLRGIKS